MNTVSERPSRRQPRASNGRHRRVSEDEFLDLYGAEDDHAEWVDGEIIEMSPDNTEHNKVGLFIAKVLDELCAHENLGEVFIGNVMTRLPSPPSRRLPDVVFVGVGRKLVIHPTYIDGAPDLVVEVVSPDSASRDYREKYQDYERSGVREYWIVDPMNQQLEAYHLERGKYALIPERNGRVASRVVKGFYLKPEWLWQRPLPSALKVLREMGLLKG